MEVWMTVNLGSAKPATSVLVADDHLLLAEAVAAALQAPPRFYETALASNLAETLQALSSGAHFDLVLLDVRMPGMMGLKSIIKVIHAASPAQVCLISGEVDRDLVHMAVENGARGLIPKTMSVKSLASVVEFVLSGQIFIPADDQREAKAGKSGDGAVLSEKEVGIVRLTSEGFINKEIASAIGSSEVTVKMHMRSICGKLKARNRAHAVAICRQRGLL
jgi:two-component system nitrate/nitrite response regulator NarP